MSPTIKSGIPGFSAYKREVGREGQERACNYNAQKDVTDDEEGMLRFSTYRRVVGREWKVRSERWCKS